MSNQAEGAAFEASLRRFLAARGYWVTKLVEGENGAPLDLLAVKSGRALAVECKVCATLRFPLSRVEDNQWRGMRAFQKHAGEAVFALLSPAGEVCVFPYRQVLAAKLSGKAALLLPDAEERWELDAP